MNHVPVSLVNSICMSIFYFNTSLFYIWCFSESFEKIFILCLIEKNLYSTEILLLFKFYFFIILIVVFHHQDFLSKLVQSSGSDIA